jgi:hypothetical protein
MVCPFPVITVLSSVHFLTASLLTVIPIPASYFPCSSNLWASTNPTLFLPGVFDVSCIILKDCSAVKLHKNN